MRAFVVGYTGATGSELVKVLANDKRYTSVNLIGRRVVNVDYNTEDEAAKSKFTQHVVNFDELEKHKDVFSDCDVGFSALGTTARQSTQAEYRVIDHDYALKVADLSCAAGCKQFHLISSKGADSNSMFFYPKLKAEIEAGLQQFKFSEFTSIYRPALLLGTRSESRLGERIAQAFFKPIAALKPTWLTIPITTLAKALAEAPFSLPSLMEQETRSTGTGDQPDYKVYILENDKIHALANFSTQDANPI